ncbi:MAG: radical SAM family heme chaperone HemW [Candidatus Poribacteria bacterium]|nr:radical SAM family heme chaperone HemW [Candidatus Poribacteria bacterium]
MNPDISLYVHIPFCLRKCRYCDFATYPLRPDLMDPFLSALETEAESVGAEVQGAVKTLFFGGGTPSLLDGRQMGWLMDALRRSFNIQPQAEITLEANPETADEPRLRAYRNAGVNRLSIGAQTFDDAALKQLDRTHSSEQINRAYQNARNAGFENINLDMMFALPGQTMRKWQEDARRSLSLDPEHLSVYNLTIEPKTVFHYWNRQGRLSLPDEDLQADMYEWTLDEMERAGYPYYELSNFAKPGSECEHNLRYWRNKPHAGIGPGACGYLNGERTANTRGTRSYIKRIEEGRDPIVERERLAGKAARAETIRQGLRMRSGVPLTEYARRYGLNLLDDFQAEIEQITRLGLTKLADGALRLTRRGVLLANEAFLRLLPESALS